MSDDCRIVHHIVYSVKGGSGKTSFSLLLTLANLFFDYEDEENPKLSLNWNNAAASREVANYMLDLDFLGTSLMYAFSLENEKPLVTVPNMIFDRQRIAYIDCQPGGGRILNAVGGNEEEKYILYSNNRERDKEKFHVKRENTPLLKYDEFGYEIENIQREIKLHARSRDVGNSLKQLNLIYDLPPNSDGYTDALLREVSGLPMGKKAEDGHEQRVVLYLLYSNAMTLRCNVDWLESFLNGVDDRKMDVVFVYCINDRYGVESASTDERARMRESLVKSQLACLGNGAPRSFFFEFPYCPGIHDLNNRTSDDAGSAVDRRKLRTNWDDPERKDFFERI